MRIMSQQTETKITKSGRQTTQRIVGIFFGAVEVILAIRLIFKLLGANPGNGFVQGIYSVTQFFVGIFEGIFSRSATSGEETAAVFEPATLIAMVVIALIAWGVLKLLSLRTKSSVENAEYTKLDDRVR